MSKKNIIIKLARCFNSRICLFVLLSAYFSAYYSVNQASAQTSNIDREANSHIRILLDTSLSMVTGPTNDPNKLSVLAALMFFDVMSYEELNISGNDTFKVLPFDYDYSKGKATRSSQAGRPSTGKWQLSDPAPDPTSKAPFIELTNTLAQSPETGRATFLGKIKNLKRDAKWTYFSPGLSRIIDDIEASPNSQQAIKTIILVTDGEADGDADTTKYKAIAERLSNNNIELIILGFGAAATPSPELQQLITHGNKSVGRMSLVQHPSQIMDAMMSIFAQNYNYSVDKISPAKADRSQISITASNESEKIITVSTRIGTEIPKYRLVPPSGQVIADQPYGESVESSNGNVTAAYYMYEHDKPKTGLYQLNIVNKNISALELFILKPAKYYIQLNDPTSEKYIPGVNISRVIAGEYKFPAHVFSNAVGGGKPPTDYALQYRVKDDQGKYDPTERYQTTSADSSKTQQIASLAVTRAATNNPLPNAGALFYVSTNLTDRGEIYNANLEAKIGKGDGSERGKNRSKANFTLEVFPRIDLRVQEAIRFDASGKLGEGQTQCSSFKLTDENKNLKDVLPSIMGASANAGIALQAYLKSDKAADLSKHQLNSATFHLNNIEIGFDSRKPAVFNLGDINSAETLLMGPDEDGYELCVTMGIPIDSAANPGEVFNITLQFVINTDPYNAISEYAVLTSQAIKPATVRMSIQISQWNPWSLLVFLLVSLTMLRQIRAVPTLENDLVFTFTQNTENLNPVQYNFQPPTPLQTILRIVASHEMLDPETNKPFAILKPLKGEDLYRITLAKGYNFQLSSTARSDMPNQIDAQVGHRYEIIASDKIRYLSITFADETQEADLA